MRSRYNGDIIFISAYKVKKMQKSYKICDKMLDIALQILYIKSVPNL